MALETSHEVGSPAGAPTRAQRTRAVAPPWFALLYALAVAAHVGGNPAAALDAHGLVTIALVVGAVALVRWPSSRASWACVAVVQLATVWLETPVLGNHWLLLGCVSAAVLLALPRAEPWTWLAPAVRCCFVVFYAFAAFAKLNTAFLSPGASCAVFYADQGLRSWGLPALPDGGLLPWLPITAALTVELAVPALLLVPRTRSLGVALGATFHYLISLDLAQHFYDFTAVILLGLAVFAPDEVTAPIDAWIRRRRRTMALIVTAWAALALAATLPAGGVVAALTRLAVFVLWVPLGAAVVWLAVRAVGRPADVRIRPAGLAAACLVALVVVNGLLPYVGVKTASGWNMYANLATGGGRPNHLVLAGVPALRDVDYVRVTATSDRQLQRYVGSGWAVPEVNLRDRLAAHPGATVTFTRADGTIVSGAGRELGEPLPSVLRRALPLRSVDLSGPARCQALWLPAL